MSCLDRPFTILLVDEDPAEARLIKEAWSECDVVRTDFHTVHNAQAAMDFCSCTAEKARRPNLILLSYTTSLNGEEALRMLKGSPVSADIPVLVLTALTTPETVRDIYRKKANCCFAKPAVGFSELVQAIASHWLGVAVLPDPTA
jgi:CheY-like chemotaxis protein